MTKSFGWHTVDSNYYADIGRLENWKAKCKAPVRFLNTICDDLSYTWSAKKNAILVSDYNTVLKPGSTDVQYKEWRLAFPITFEVHTITVNKFIGIYCLLWGSKGVALVRFPAFSFQKGPVKAPCTLLGEKIHVECSSLKIFQAKLALDHMKKVAVILYNDRYIRVYDANSGEILVVLSATTGHHLPMNTDGYYDANLLPVDFDFGPCLPKTQFWTIFALRASGRIQTFFVRILEKTNKCITEVHKVMDNKNGMPDANGEDIALSILSTSDFPTVLVVATNAGTIYHSVLLPTCKSDTDPETLNSCRVTHLPHLDYYYERDMFYNVESKMLKNEMILRTREVVRVKPQDKKLLSFVKLIPDPLFHQRYVCIHEYGAQLFTIRFANEIVKYMNDPLKEDTGFSTSVVRHLVRWKFDSSPAPEQCLLGASFSDTMPQTLLFVLGDGSKTLMYGLPDPYEYYYDLKKAKEQSKYLENQVANPARHVSGYDNVLENCQRLIKKSKILPLIYGDQIFKGKDLRNIMLKAITLAMEHIKNINEASVFLGVFMTSLYPRTKEIAISVQNVLADKVHLKMRAENMAEKYEERSETEELFQKRLEYILYYLGRANPMMTDKEKYWLKHFETVESENIDLQTLVCGLKGKMSQPNHSCKSTNDARLTATQLQQIKFELANQNDALFKLKESLRSTIDYAYWKTDIIENVPL